MIEPFFPYCGPAPLPSELLSRWNFDPFLMGGFGLAVLGYARFRYAVDRQGLCFAAAIFLCVLLFISPLCALSSALFSARVAHHILLSAAVAPLLAFAWPAPTGYSRIAAWTIAQAVLFWAWHAPPLYAWALSSDLAYWLMQASILLPSIFFWRALRAASGPAGVVALLATMVLMGLLGALITFSGNPLYAPHALTTLPWGYTQMDDQQLAGLIMWAPSAGFYLGAALLLLGRWLSREEAARA
ncbi:cytochrome c oxidase assembly protein [Allosphingosinicella vermicomposti]|uniref:cytochrome c oxidase assembly protein n=1 Tax=Allosphingosinicella vermicomposti TaxID=614671 RepID=UPI000D0F2F53|nr:cytochrome c oxidase assembly protein [Allosphingosinicella vermicomposti]